MDRGDIVLGWLAKLVVVLGLLGLVAFDALAIVATRTALHDDGTSAALAGSSAWRESGNVQLAYAAASAAAIAGSGDTAVEAFRVDPDGTVHPAVSRTADTIVLRRIGPLRNWATVEATTSARAMQ